MIRTIALLLALSAPAAADQLDFLFSCASEAACIADPVLGAFHSPASTDGPGGWRGDVVIPNIQVWDSRQDVGGTDPDGNPTVTHTYLSGFWMVVSSNGPNTLLSGDGNLVLLADRDAANKGLPFVLSSVQPDDQLAFFMLSPLFAGSNYPFGAPK